MVSTDRGITSAILENESNRVPANGSITRTFDGFSSFTDPRFFNSSGYIIQHGFDIFHPTQSVYAGIQTGIPAHLTTTYYKMQGYYVSGAVYENWLGINSPNSMPPSGHTLTNVIIIGTFSVST